MKIGTKSILFGVHQFVIHPLFVALAWWKLYGFPFDPRLWIAFFVHDLGYFGKPNMDGREGEQHPIFGAAIMDALFGPEWHDFTLYHSRFLAKQNDAKFSRLCVADKFSFCLTPAWLYLPLARLTGEIHEYMKLAEARGDQKYASANVYSTEQAQWHANVSNYLRKWVEQHRDCREDTWTPKVKW